MQIYQQGQQNKTRQTQLPQEAQPIDQISLAILCYFSPVASCRVCRAAVPTPTLSIYVETKTLVQNCRMMRTNYTSHFQVPVSSKYKIGCNLNGTLFSFRFQILHPQNTFQGGLAKIKSVMRIYLSYYVIPHIIT